MPNLAAVIVAAGVSSRMGRFKPMLQVDGRTMIQRVVSAMRTAGASPVVVVTGYRHEVLEEHLANEGVLFVHNARYFETQMLDSLLLGLDALPEDTEKVLITPADIPLVKPETIQALLNAKGDFIRPICGSSTGHPAVMSPALIQRIKDYRGGGGLRGVIASGGIVPTDVPVDDFGTVLDSDTRDEYAELMKYRRRETNTPQPLQLDLRIGLYAETSFWGPDSAQFLELIQTTGSMLGACQCMHISYSRGWRMVNEIERQLGFQILVRTPGGNSGGGSELTEQGKHLLIAFQSMQEEIRTTAQEIFARYFQTRDGGLPAGLPASGGQGLCPWTPPAL
ncbi:MAG: NTP transferase domain-containing protein [Oscillibacter sp.]|nr:NTP transferase domain-containing protein [Oscillibacter sp.]